PWIVGSGLSLLAVCLGVVALVLGLHHGDKGVAAPDRVPQRAEYSNPSDYAAAMTRLTLTAVKTKLEGKPTCNTRSTWNRWACLAKGRPTIGAFAGRLLTFRCSPRYHPQPGGKPAARMIDCKPTALPS